MTALTAEPPVELSPYAADLWRVLTTPVAPDDPVCRRWPDMSLVSDVELGALLAASFRHTGPIPARDVRWAVEYTARERPPRFTPASFAALLAASADRVASRNWTDPAQATAALVRGAGEAGTTGDGAPDGWSALAGAPPHLRIEVARSARVVAAELLGGWRIDHPYPVLAIAALVDAGTLRGAVARVCRGWDALAREEVELVMAGGAPALALLADAAHDGSYRSIPPLTDRFQRLAALPGYRGFGRRILEQARQRVAEIQSGARPFAADKAFTKQEIGVLGRATRVALLHDERWLPPLLDEVLPGVAVAPTQARTLPSQGLLYEVARSTVDFPTPEALAALRAARAVTRHKAVPKQLDRKLAQIERALAARPDVAFRLPDLGFGPDGTHSEQVGGYTATVALGGADVSLTWCRPDGTRSATVPAQVRREHPDQLKRLRGLARQAGNHARTLARSLEAGYTSEATWPYRRWHDELATNPLGWHIAGRLIWEIEAEPGAWRAVLPVAGNDGAGNDGAGNDGAGNDGAGNDGAGIGLRDAAGRTVVPPGPDAAVRLWHPIRATTDQVRAWRDALEVRGVRQPFKQAYREVYLLTDAERRTDDHSNRFAAHIVRYRAFYAMVKERGWETRMLGPWDGGDTAEAVGRYADGAWRACFQHDYVEPAHQQGADLECAATGRVSFRQARDGAWRQVCVERVPAMVFSEAMRDVDLLVAVTSIATDPAWIDTGGARYEPYWREASTADLSGTAEVRRQALQRIVPRLRIADRCEVTARHLVVRGELRTYRIHIGSGNVLMDPDDTYLCIVPARQASPGFMVPFEDGQLSVVLSKAFLLADDARITDPSILGQLRARG